MALDERLEYLSAAAHDGPDMAASAAARQQAIAALASMPLAEREALGSALGFRNLTNYIARSLLETGGFRPQLHPRFG